MVTPLNAADELDTAGVEKLVEHLLSADISGIFILGTTGEFSNISYRLRHELIEKVCRQVNGRVKVLVGVADTSMTESINLAHKAADHGADAVVATPPYYYANAQPELVQYFTHLAEKLPLPLFLYNMPVHTKVMIEPATVRQIAGQSKNVIGLKDSSANMTYLRLVQYAMKDHPDFPLFVGPEEMTADAVLLGASGGVNGGANMFPKLYVELYKAGINRDFDRIKILQEKVLQISSLIYTVGRYGSSYLKGLKCALSVLDICNDFLAEPFDRFKEEERNIISRRLQEIDMTAFTKTYL